MKAYDSLWGYCTADQWLAESTGLYRTSRDYLFCLAQGRPECFPLPCMLVCRFVCANRTRDRGCSKHPVFPAPSEKEGGKLLANLGRSAPRDRECVSTVGWVERSETHHLLRRP